MINKMIEVVPGERWVVLTEMPNGTIRLEGFQEDPGLGSYLASHIVFTEDAIKAMLPSLIEWVKE